MPANYVEVLIPAPGHVQLGMLNDFHVTTRVTTVAPCYCEDCWAEAYLASENVPPNALAGQSLLETASTATTSTNEGTLTLNACGEEFGIVVTAELGDGSGVPSYITCDTGLVYFGDCARMRKKPKKLKKSIASQKTQRPRTVARKKSAGAARKSARSRPRKKVSKK